MYANAVAAVDSTATRLPQSDDPPRAGGPLLHPPRPPDGGHLQHLRELGGTDTDTDTSRVDPTPTADRHYGHLLVGGGVRTIWNLIDYLQLLQEHRPALEALRRQGADFRHAMRLGVIDSQPGSRFGGGNAFTDAHDGTQNTPAEPGIEDLYRNYLRQHYQELLDHPSYRDNPPARQMLGEAGALAAPTDDHFLVSRAVLLRRDMGRMDREHYEALLAQVAQWFPELAVDRLHETRAVGLELGGPQPVVRTRHDPSGAGQRLQAGFVSLHTGTTLQAPVTGPAAELFFQQPMNRHDIGAALRRLDLLDDGGRLRPGSRLVGGGLGLSALDVLIALNPFTGLLAMQGDRWVVDRQAAARYQGALTMMSRHLQPALPRYTYDVDLPASVLALGTTEELLALFVHGDGRQVFDAWFTLEQAAIASALGSTPAEQQRPRSLDELLEVWRRQTEAVRAIENQAKQLPPAERQARLAACAEQEEALKRAIHLRTVVGLGMEHAGGAGDGPAVLPASRTLEQTFALLRERYPRLADQRIGHCMHRAHTYAVSQPGNPDAGSDESLFAVLDWRMRWVTASPWQVQSMLGELHRAGVLHFRQGSYHHFSLHPCADGRQRLLHRDDRSAGDGGPPDERRCFDMGLVQPVFQARTPFAASFGDQVQSGIAEVPGAEADQAFHPALTKNNLLTLRGTDRVLPVAHYGLSMHGWRAASGARHNVMGLDRNDKDATVADSRSKALHDLALAVLQAAGVPDAPATLEQCYREESADGEAAYRAETARLWPFFDSAMAKADALRCFGQQMARPANGPVTLEYGQFRLSAPDAASAFVQAVRALTTNARLPGHAGPGALDCVVAAWRRSRRHQPYRPPPAVADYESRFVDHPPFVHEGVLRRAFALAERRLAAPHDRGDPSRR